MRVLNKDRTLEEESECCIFFKRHSDWMLLKMRHSHWLRILDSDPCIQMAQTTITSLEHILLLVEKRIEDENAFEIDAAGDSGDDAMILTEARNLGSNMLENALIESCKTQKETQAPVSETSVEETVDKYSRLSIFSPKSIVSNVEWLGRTTVDITNTIIPG